MVKSYSPFGALWCRRLQGETYQEDPQKNLQTFSETSVTAYMSKRHYYKNDFELQLSASRQKKTLFSTEFVT
jgi:hypothetical protein